MPRHSPALSSAQMAYSPTPTPRIDKMEDAMDRFMAVLKWYMSGYHVRPKGCKKPYNPLLGEQFYASWSHDNGSETVFVSEQVSHHPPVSAFYMDSRKNGSSLCYCCCRGNTRSQSWELCELPPCPPFQASSWLEISGPSRNFLEHQLEGMCHEV
jgi:oxysterol-binding protein